ncbi:uncharacterized protein [Epargyreus clarus]|uniref:uncharacterized protein isoform X3 n=1 Tax=Epargyreus clarus TaxID=520877 RepID=UPI003C2AB7DD
MGDGLKLCKDKRHRSSSSLAGGVVEGTRSERKIDVRASIPEVDDHFAIAEARCDDLQEKIDLVKHLKRKKKLKKRSTTRMVEAPTNAEHVPFISVRTQPKKKVSPQAARLRRLEVPPNPTRGYLDAATVEQHDMLGHVRGYHQMYRQLQDHKNKQKNAEQRSPSRMQQSRRTRADGDGFCGQGVQICSNISSQEVACGEDILEDTDSELYDQRRNEFSIPNVKNRTGLKQPKKSTQARGRNDAARDVSHKLACPQKWSDAKQDEQRQKHRSEAYSAQKIRRSAAGNKINIDLNRVEERPVVELFNKSRDSATPTSWLTQNVQPPASPGKKNKKGYEQQRYDDEETGHLEKVASNTRKEKEVHRHPRRVKYRSRRYELPTVASQMKQAGMRCYYGTTNHTNIPFVVSKSTAPSHNIGVNIQQVLNGLKIQQPLSGIPLTIAHHMGLGHIPTYGTRSITTPSLDNREINAIRLGPRLVRLPSYKCMSYNRMLSLYRQGEGMVPRFLRAISRPHYFYTSMYNSLVSNREDMDGATSKGRAGSHEAKASLAEYASLYREYEQIERNLSENYEPELERRKEALARQLAAREEHIRKVVEEYHTPAEGEQSGLRASASTAEDAYRQSTFKLNSDEPHP